MRPLGEGERTPDEVDYEQPISGIICSMTAESVISISVGAVAISAFFLDDVTKLLARA